MLQGPKSLVHVRVRTSCNRSGTHRDSVAWQATASAERIAASVLEVCLGATPVHGVHIYRRFRREAAPSSEGLDWPALMRYEAEFRACDVRDMSVHPGLRGRAVRRQDVHGRGRPAGGAVPDRQPRGEASTATRRQPFQPITTCQHFPGGQPLTTRANGEEGLRARGRHPGGRRRVVHSPVHY